MNVLAIDTTTKTASVSIKNDNTLFMDKVENEITHSEKLLPLIDKVLNEANIKISDISTLACINLSLSGMLVETPSPVTR